MDLDALNWNGFAIFICNRKPISTFKRGKNKQLINKFNGGTISFCIGVPLFNWASETSPTLGCSIEISRDIYIYYIPPPLTVHFPMMRSVRYQPIFNGLKFTLHRARVLNNVVITTVIEMVEILDGRVCNRSVERVRYVINNLLHFGHCEIWSHFTCTLYFHSTSARDNTNATREISRHISR